MNRLPDDIGLYILQFVGKGHFAFVAGTNQDLCLLYREFATNNKKKVIETTEEDTVNCSDDKNDKRESLLSISTAPKITTSMESVIESISRCKFYLSDGQQSQQETQTTSHVIPRLSWLVFSSSGTKDEYENEQKIDQLELSNRQQKLINLAKAAARHGNLTVFQFAMEELDPCVMQNSCSRWILCNAVVTQGNQPLATIIT